MKKERDWKEKKDYRFLLHKSIFSIILRKQTPFHFFLKKRNVRTGELSEDTAATPANTQRVITYSGQRWLISENPILLIFKKWFTVDGLFNQNPIFAACSLCFRVIARQPLFLTGVDAQTYERVALILFIHNHNEIFSLCHISGIWDWKCQGCYAMSNCALPIEGKLSVCHIVVSWFAAISTHKLDTTSIQFER